jgi:hypothetical protein
MKKWVDLLSIDRLDLATMEALRREVSKVTGCEEEMGAVKRALQEARKKLRFLLREWLFDQGGER